MSFTVDSLAGRANAIQGLNSASVAGLAVIAKVKGDTASRQGLQGLACFTKLGRRRASTALGVAGPVLFWKDMQLMQTSAASAPKEPATSTL